MSVPELGGVLTLDRCPHCGIANPHLPKKQQFDTQDAAKENQRFWRIYVCTTCGGAVSAWASGWNEEVQEMFPAKEEIDSAIPSPASDFLAQAHESLHAPAGAVMLCASAVDAMLKAKGFTDGSLYNRIGKAKDGGLITEGMAAWAHEVRLDANEPRHADEDAPLPSEERARKAVDFATQLGVFLFVLPARVERGLSEAKQI